MVSSYPPGLHHFMDSKIHFFCWRQTCTGFDQGHNVLKSKCPPLLLWSVGVSWTTSVCGNKVIGPLLTWQEWGGCCYKKCNNGKEAVLLHFCGKVWNEKYRLSCYARAICRRKECLSTHCYQLVDNGPPRQRKWLKTTLRPKRNFELLLHFDIPSDYSPA